MLAVNVKGCRDDSATTTETRSRDSSVQTRQDIQTLHK